jgi:hypothetical protein
VTLVGSCLPEFRDNLLVTSSRIEQSAAA